MSYVWESRESTLGALTSLWKPFELAFDTRYSVEFQIHVPNAPNAQCMQFQKHIKDSTCVSVILFQIDDTNISLEHMSFPVTKTLHQKDLLNI